MSSDPGCACAHASHSPSSWSLLRGHVRPSSTVIIALHCAHRCICMIFSSLERSSTDHSAAIARHVYLPCICLPWRHTCFGANGRRNLIGCFLLRLFLPGQGRVTAIASSVPYRAEGGQGYWIRRKLASPR